jgi:anti-sigma-K factor RskA
MATERQLLELIADRTASLPELGRRVDLVEVRVEQLEADVQALDPLPDRLIRLETEHAERSRPCAGDRQDDRKLTWRTALLTAATALLTAVITYLSTAGG